MKNEAEVSGIFPLTMEHAIDSVRTMRNEQIKKFLNPEYLRIYFKTQYDKDLSPVRLEFISRDLQQLLIAPVDLVHYSMILMTIKESGNINIPEESMALFTMEIELIFKKYSY